MVDNILNFVATFIILTLPMYTVTAVIYLMVKQLKKQNNEQ